jgi:hypothetical protein
MRRRYRRDRRRPAAAQQVTPLSPESLHFDRDETGIVGAEVEQPFDND